ncbi:MAG: DNA polymerase/3'-5' exonuclease PolX [Chloroflexi bacterium]|nr:DNA polymerase/3'-5' exonuclease PolX [Chloroflexota bacterium]
MDNTRVAEILGEIAELMDIKGENSFKVRAYEKAAKAVGAVAGPLSDYLEQDALETIPGIGKGIAARIGEMLEDGGSALLEELRDEFPPQILSLMKVPGLGPRKAAQLYRGLGIGNIQELKEAASLGRIASLKGFGKKTEEKILRGIDIVSAYAGRLPLGVVLPLARDIINKLSKIKGVIKVVETGSVRRRKETVGDLEIIAAAGAHDFGGIMDSFSQAAVISEIHSRERNRIRLKTADNFLVSLRLVEPDQFGAALVRFTGSKEHADSLQETAKNKGIGTLGNSILDIPGGEEEIIYSALGMEYIPPEIRENKGEITGAAEHKLPILVTPEDIKGDLHIHTNYTDGMNTIEEMVKAAIACGYEYIAVSDHSQSLKVAGGLSPERLKAQQKEIDEVGAAYPGFRIFKAAEVDILPDGKLDYDEETLKNFDFVIGSIHSYFNQDIDTMTKRILCAMEDPRLLILGHPSGRLIGSRNELKINWDEVLKAAAKRRVILEINSFPERLDLNDERCRKAKEMGIKVSINTDSHSINHLKFVEYGVMVARRGWLDKKDVLNTMKSKELENWLAERSEFLKGLK